MGHKLNTDNDSDVETSISKILKCDVDQNKQIATCIKFKDACVNDFSM